MAVVASDDFTGIGTSAATSRALNNALGGSGSRTWALAGAASLYGDGSNGLVSSANINARNSVDLSATSVKTLRVRYDPQGATAQICLFTKHTKPSGSGNYVMLLLAANQTSLRIREGSSQTIPAGTDRATTTITAPGTTFWLELEVDGLVVTGRVLNLDTSVRNTVTYTFGALPSGNSSGFGMASSGTAGIWDNFTADDGAGGDTEAPTFTGSITVGAKTSSTIALALPTASDNVAVTGYEYRVDGGAWVDNGNSTAVALSGLEALTSYTIDARAYDAAPNYSATLSVTTSTYRSGASAGSIVAATGPQDGQPKGWLYDLAQTLPVDAWVSFRILSGPTPAGGTLDVQPNGAGTYIGPSPAAVVIQPEVNGVDTPETTSITLFDQSGGGGDVQAPTWTGSILLLGRGTTTASVQLPPATDETGPVTYEYRLNGGAWTATGSTVNLSGLAEATNYTLEGRALDAAPNYSTVLSISFTTRSSVQAGPPTTRWEGSQWVPGGVFRRGNGAGGLVTGGVPRRWTGTDWT